MASVTTLGFSILSRYHGGGVRAARRDLATLRAQMVAFNRDIREHTNILGGIPSRWKAIGGAALTVAPALYAISAAALQVVGAFTAMTAAVGVAVGAYALAVKNAIDTTNGMAKAGKALSSQQKAFLKQQDAMNKAIANFGSGYRDQILKGVTLGMEGVTRALGKLEPLVGKITPEINRMAAAFNNWTKGGSLNNYVKIIGSAAPVALRNLIDAGRDFLNVMGDGFRAFIPLGVAMSKTIRDGAASLKAWSDSGGFQRFLREVRENSPAVRDFFRALGDALSNLRANMQYFAGGSLHLVTDALRVLAALKPENIKAFANAFLLLRSPLLWLVLNCPPLRDAIISLLEAMNPATIYAVAAAFVVMRVAFMAMNAGLLSTPLGWLIVGLAALGAGIVWLATKTQFFQTVWQYVWGFMKEVGAWFSGPFVNFFLTIGNWFAGPFVNFFVTAWNGIKAGWTALVGFFVTAWSTVSGGLVTAWNAVWNALKTAALAVWNALTTAWNFLVNTFTTAWNAVSSALSTAWNAVWGWIKTMAMQTWADLQMHWQSFVGMMTNIWNAVSGALSAAWNVFWTVLSTAAIAVWNAMQAAWSFLVNGLITLWNIVSPVLSAAWNAVWGAISAAAIAVWNAMQAAWNFFINGLRLIWSAVSSVLGPAWNAFWNAVKTAAEAVWNALRTAWSALWTAITTIWNTARTAISTAWSAFWALLRTVAQAVWNALRTAWQAFWTAVTTIWNTFRTAISTAWSAFWNLVKTVATAVWNALRTAWQAFWTAVTTIWNTFRTAISTAWSAFWNLIKTVAQAIWNWLKDAWGGFLEAIKSVWTTASSWIKEKWEDAWNWLKDKAGDIWEKIAGVVVKAVNIIIGIINGLIKGFNAIAKFLHIDVSIGAIEKIPQPKFANGGVVEFAYGGITGAPKDLRAGGTLRGYAPGRDTVPAILSKGEGVLTPEAVRGLGGAGFVHSANRKFAGHRGAGRQARVPLSRYTGTHDGVPQSRGPAGFATGGMVGVQRFAVGGMTAAALAKAGVPLGLVSQGEYSDGSLSAGTHLGGGAVDLSTTDPAVLQRLHAAGFAAWIRGAAQGMSPHIHAVLMNHPDLSGPARAQVESFLAGGSGLGVGGGGGGGGIDILGMVMPHVGKILKNVYRGNNPLMNIGGAIAQFFGIGNDEDDGGLFGTGIGPDIGPNIADAVGDVVESVTGIGGKMMEMLGQVVLAALSGDSILEGLSDAAGEFKKFGDEGAFGNFGKIVQGIGNKVLKELMPDFLLSKKDESTFNPADFAGGFAGGDVQKWAGLAAKALAMAGISSGQLNRFLALMQAESGGNPFAVNDWDTNAARGQASAGLMQVIPATFAAYRDRSLPNNIYDPLANMVAAANYIKSKYGGSVPGSPYALGTPGATSGVHLVGEQGPELLNFRGGETVTPAKETASILGGGGGAIPEELIAQLQVLASTAQQTSATVQSSWGMVTQSTSSAKSTMAPLLADLILQFGTNIPAAATAMQTANAAAWLAMQTSTDTTWKALKAGTFTEANDHMVVKMPTWGQEMNTAVSTAWQNMGEATATAWEGMKEGTRGPTNWIIDQSYNNGIRSLWNQVAEVIFEDGAKTLPTVATLAKGGPVRGPGGETADRVPAMLSRGEHVWTAREVHRAGGHHAVQAMRQGVMGRKVRGAHRGCGFALGGWLGGVGNVSGSSPAVGSLDLKRGSMMDQVGDHLDQIDSAVKGALSGSFYRRMGGSAGVTSPTDWIRQYVEKDDELNKIGSGGPPWIPGVSDAITSWGGATVNQRTADMLNMAMALGASFSITQGSFSRGVAASAGTHDGGGVVDLVPASNANVGALRAVGFAAWNRGAAWGSPSFSPHIHAVALGDPTVSPGAASQIASYLAGGNGLANGGPDNYSGGIPSVDGVAAIGGGGQNVDPADLEQRVVSYDRGGFLPPGYTLAYNGTGKPEPVGHHLEPKGSKGVEITMPITINGNADAAAVVDGINSQVLPKLRQFLAKGTGNN